MIILDVYIYEKMPQLILKPIIDRWHFSGKPVRKMRALVCRSLGDPTLPLSDASAPLYVSDSEPRPALSSAHDVRVKVKAVSINFAIGLAVMGKYQEKPPLPFIPGGDFSGVIIEVGELVTKVKVGDFVCGSVDVGAYAEEVIAEDQNVYVVPPTCDMVAAAGIPIAFGTSHLGLVHRADLQPGQVLLVLGAGGGVGLAAVQIGKLCGAVVIAAARGEEKTKLLRSMGLDFVVDTSSGSLSKSIQSFLKSKNLRGVDVLYDPVGGKPTKEALKLLNWGAKILIIGFATGEIPTIPANIILVKNWTVHGLYWGSYKRQQPEVIDKSFKQLFAWLANGYLDVHVSHVFPLSQANFAFAKLYERGAVGKVMIVLEDSNQRISSKL